MFQTFTPPDTQNSGPERTKALRKTFAKFGVAAVLVPRADEHQGEYVPASAARLKWLTGFSGSAGLAIVGAKHAALFVDGRYTAQARMEVDAVTFEILQVPDAKLAGWIGAKLPKGAVVGFDPWLHTIGEIERLETALAKLGAKLKPLAANPVDRVWGRARPKPPTGAIVPQDLAHAGEPAAEKIAGVQKTLKADAHDAAILTMPDSIAWLLNIRGSDVMHVPLPLSFAIVPEKGKPELFVDPKKIGANVKGHLEAAVKLYAPKELAARVEVLKAAGKRVRVDESTAAWWFKRKLGATGKSLARAQDPCLLPKAKKNAVELKGARAAHVRDGAAMVRFLAWLDRTAAGGGLDEIACAKHLEDFRRETGALKDISFDTISGAGPNGAIVHYRVTEKTNRALKPGELFLVDSGGQYVDGTTDITRTVAIGTPAREMQERFTLVLKGMIAVSLARFPKGTRGSELDPLARRALWAAGLDFDHGTGHGVGSYLSVHEGPQQIGRRGAAVLEPGMIISNEPGYYKDGAYGIRIENLVIVTSLETVPGGDRPMMGFETLTLCPIDRRLVVAAMLTPEERAWLDAYHARVREVLSREVTGDDRAWLERATKSIA